MWSEMKQILFKYHFELISSGDKIRKHLKENDEIDLSSWI